MTAATVNTVETSSATEAASAVVLVDDVEELTADAQPGCGNDNPYN
ncbi:hypothetical protein [Streptomyces sp. NPDC102462]